MYIHNDNIIQITSCDFPFNMQNTNTTSDLLTNKYESLFNID